MAWRSDADLNCAGTHLACRSHGALFDLELIRYGLPLILTSSVAVNYGSKMSTKGWSVQVSFARPPSFPPEWVPKPLALFVANCVPGLNKRQLLARTARLGWKPMWEPVPKLKRDDIEAYGLGLTIDGVGVPLIARMRRAAKDVLSVKVPER
ncbi:hypothetical protein [Burkholderia cepacia]|uniref:hypothetical protein n=1 Tax=Burkholderia cepacia TaxID=292 RepID=UPI002ABD5C4C|nr:hypothetical protein [Burkholderia cepacia]